MKYRIKIFQLNEECENELIDSNEFNSDETDSVELLRKGLTKCRVHLELLQDDERIPDWRVFVRDQMVVEDNNILLVAEDETYLLEKLG